MRHDDEDMIDFPVSESFRDQYAAQGLTYPAGRYPKTSGGIPPRPVGGVSDEDDDAHAKIHNLLRIIRLQRVEISTLKATAHRTDTDSRTRFEGLE